MATNFDRFLAQILAPVAPQIQQASQGMDPRLLGQIAQLAVQDGAQGVNRFAPAQAAPQTTAQPTTGPIPVTRWEAGQQPQTTITAPLQGPVPNPNAEYRPPSDPQQIAPTEPALPMPQVGRTTADYTPAGTPLTEDEAYVAVELLVPGENGTLQPHRVMVPEHYVADGAPEGVTIFGGGQTTPAAQVPDEVKLENQPETIRWMFTDERDQATTEQRNTPGSDAALAEMAATNPEPSAASLTPEQSSQTALANQGTPQGPPAPPEPVTYSIDELADQDLANQLRSQGITTIREDQIPLTDPDTGQVRLVTEQEIIDNNMAVPVEWLYQDEAFITQLKDAGIDVMRVDQVPVMDNGVIRLADAPETSSREAPGQPLPPVTPDFLEQYDPAVAAEMRSANISEIPDGMVLTRQENGRLAVLPSTAVDVDDILFYGGQSSLPDPGIFRDSDGNWGNPLDALGIAIEALPGDAAERGLQWLDDNTRGLVATDVGNMVYEVATGNDVDRRGWDWLNERLDVLNTRNTGPYGEMIAFYRERPELAEQLYTQGYDANGDGVADFVGGRALWEYHVGAEQNLAERIIGEIVMDPLNAVGLVGPGLARTGRGLMRTGATTSLPRAVIGRGLDLTGRALQFIDEAPGRAALAPVRAVTNRPARATNVPRRFGDSRAPVDMQDAALQRGEYTGPVGRLLNPSEGTRLEREIEPYTRVVGNVTGEARANLEARGIGITPDDVPPGAATPSQPIRDARDESPVTRPEDETAAQAMTPQQRDASIREADIAETPQVTTIDTTGPDLPPQAARAEVETGGDLPSPTAREWGRYAPREDGDYLISRLWQAREQYPTRWRSFVADVNERIREYTNRRRTTDARSRTLRETQEADRQARLARGKDVSTLPVRDFEGAALDAVDEYEVLLDVYTAAQRSYGDVADIRHTFNTRYRTDTSRAGKDRRYFGQQDNYYIERAIFGTGRQSAAAFEQLRYKALDQGNTALMSELPRIQRLRRQWEQMQGSRAGAPVRAGDAPEEPFTTTDQDPRVATATDVTQQRELAHGLGLPLLADTVTTRQYAPLGIGHDEADGSLGIGRHDGDSVIDIDPDAQIGGTGALFSSVPGGPQLSRVLTDPQTGKWRQVRNPNAGGRLDPEAQRNSLLLDTSNALAQRNQDFLRGDFRVVLTNDELATLGRRIGGTPDSPTALQIWERFRSEALANGADRLEALEQGAERMLQEVYADTLRRVSPEKYATYQKTYTEILAKAPDADPTAAHVTAVRVAGQDGRQIPEWYDTYLSIQREIRLYNPITGARYVMTQAVGNTITSLLGAGLVRGTQIARSAIGETVEDVRAMRQGRPRGAIADLRGGKRLTDWTSPVDDPSSIRRAALEEEANAPGITLDAADRFMIQVGLFENPVMLRVPREEGMGLRSAKKGNRGIGTAELAEETMTRRWLEKRRWTRPFAKRGSGVLASKNVREIANALDLSFRKATFVQRMQMNLAGVKPSFYEHAREMLPDASATARLDEAWAALPEHFSDTHLRNALLDIDPRYAESLGRDWRATLRAMERDADAEVNRLFFSGQELRGDEALRRIIMFHYWMSRATPLYTASLMKHVGLMTNYFQMMQELKENSAQYGKAVSGMLSLFDNLLGYNIFIRPDSMLQTVMALGGYEGGFEPENESGLVKFLRETGLFFNPGIMSALNYAGLSGDTFAPDPFSLQTHAAFVVTGIDFLKSMLPGIDRPTRNMYQEFNGWLREQSTDLVGEPIPFQRSDQFAMVEINNLIIDIAEDERGMDWNDPQDQATIIASMNDPESELYQAAFNRYATANMTQQALRILPTAVLYPKLRSSGKDERALTIRTTERSDPENQMARDQRDYAQITDPQVREIRKQQDDYQRLGTEEQRDAYSTYNAIRFGPVQTPIVYNGVAISERQLRTMSADERKAVADRWAEQTGVAEGIDEIRALRETYREQHPAYARYYDWSLTVGDTEGGAQAYWNALIRTNPNARRYYESLEEAQTGDLERELTSVQAYFAAEGMRPTGYDPDPLSTGSGNPATMPATGVGYQEYEADPAQRIREDLADYYSQADAVDAQIKAIYGPEASLEVIMNANPMWREGYLARLEREGIEVPKLGRNATEFIQWAEAQPPGADVSVDTYVAWTRANETETTVTPEEAEERIRMGLGR